MALPESGGKSTLEDLSIKRFNRRTHQVEKVTTVTTSRSQLLPNNSNRLFVSLINEGANDVRVSHDPTLSASSGWLLSAGGGVLQLFWEEDGEAVGWEIFAIASAGSINVRSVETVMT